MLVTLVVCIPLAVATKMSQKGPGHECPLCSGDTRCVNCGTFSPQ